MSTDYTLKARRNFKDIVDVYNEEAIINKDFNINEIFERDEEKRQTFELEKVD